VSNSRPTSLNGWQLRPKLASIRRSYAGGLGGLEWAPPPLRHSRFVSSLSCEKHREEEEGVTAGEVVRRADREARIGAPLVPRSRVGSATIPGEVEGIATTKLQCKGMLAYMKRTTVKLPDDLDAKLRHEAQAQGKTISELTREAIEAHLGHNPGSGRRLMAGSAGHSGHTDISEHIEEILRAEVSR